MATLLETNLQNILREKNEKLIPENIKEGITILGVTGTLKESGGNTTDREYITDGLITHYKLNTDFADSTGNTTMTNGGLTLMYDETLLRNVCKSGTGRGTISKPTMSSSDFTLSILAKSDGTNTAEHNMIFGFYGSASGASCIIKAHYGKLSIERNYSSIDTTFDVNDEQWHRYTFVVENGSTVRVYADTNLVVEQTGSYNFSLTTLLLGNYISSFDMPFKGGLAEALIYNRALTTAEVIENSNADNL